MKEGKGGREGLQLLEVWMTVVSFAGFRMKNSCRNYRVCTLMKMFRSLAAESSLGRSTLT